MDLNELRLAIQNDDDFVIGQQMEALEHRLRHAERTGFAPEPNGMAHRLYHGARSILEPAARDGIVSPKVLARIDAVLGDIGEPHTAKRNARKGSKKLPIKRDPRRGGPRR